MTEALHPDDVNITIVDGIDSEDEEYAGEVPTEA